MKTITITFGDCGENHVGMQKIGEQCNKGFTLDDLWNIADSIGEKDNYDVYDLSLEDEEAYILVIRGGVNKIVDSDKLYEELLELSWDKKSYMYGRVCSKKARYNLCFGESAQEPDYENKKGRVVKFDGKMKKLHDSLSKLTDSKLIAEGNYYYGDGCGIGFHGDAERKKVIGVRFGDPMKMQFQWWKNGKEIGDLTEFTFNHGDIYVLSEKATGNDWKKKKIPTLRHAAGFKKFIKL